MKKRIAFSIIGTGMVSQIHAQVINSIEEAELSCVYSRNIETGKQFAEKFNCGYTTDLEKIVNNPDIDVVSICTPSGTHADLIRLAAIHKKHVIVEKPLDISLEKADQAIVECEKNGVTLCVIFQLRFMQETQKAKKILDSGLLGKLLEVDAYMKFYRPESYYQNSNWKGTQNLDGGGALINQGIHGIDLLLWLAGPVESVTSKVKTLRHNIEVEDTAAAIVNFANGAIGVIQGTTSIYPDYPQLLTFHGTNGTLELLGTEAPYINKLEILYRSDLKIVNPKVPQDHLGEAHRLQYLNFISSLLTKTEPLVNGQEGRKSLELVKAIYDSSIAGRTVSLLE